VAGLTLDNVAPSRGCDQRAKRPRTGGGPYPRTCRSDSAGCGVVSVAPGNEATEGKKNRRKGTGHGAPKECGKSIQILESKHLTPSLFGTTGT